LEKCPSEYFKNLFFDTSGSKSQAVLLTALEMVDSDHVLFGSDLPANQGVSSSISAIQKATISDSNKGLILRNNLLKLLNLK